MKKDVCKIEQQKMAFDFTVPALLTDEYLKVISNLSNENKGGTYIAEVYGCISDSILGHGRSAEFVERNNSLEKINKFIFLYKNKNINYNYLFNAPYSSNDISEEKAYKHIYEVIDVVNPSSITVSSLKIGKIIRSIAPKIPLVISTIAGIKNIKNLEPFLVLNPKIVIPHHDLGRDFVSLKNLINNLEPLNINIRIIVNESCIYNCNKRQSHYKYIASGYNDNYYQKWCNELKYEYPIRLLGAGWVRPEDLNLMYEKFGITKFKISGREKTEDWLIEVIMAYLNKNYEGNLIKLLGITPPWTTAPWEEIIVENKSMDGFLKELISVPPDYQKKYYVKWMKKLCIGLENSSIIKKK
jgi:collagenase-like PrtC family protease